MRLIISEDNLHFIYGLNHGNEKIVVHQQLPGGKPQVITRLFNEDFFVRRDNSGCIYIICRVTDKFWQQSVYRYGSWSRPEEYADNCIVRDVICTGYKTFCSIRETDEGVFFYNGDAKFEVLGENPSIVKYNEDYLVLSEIDGRIFYTGKNGRNKIISGGTYADFHVRFPDSGEYSVCERCRGSVSQGKAKLFIIDKMPTQSASVGESVRVEMTKHTIKLETQIADLEKRIATLEMELNSYKPQPEKQAPRQNQP